MEQSEPVNFEEAAVRPAERTCRRCRNLFESDALTCPICGASNQDRESTAGRGNPIASLAIEQALVSVCISYGIMLGAAVLWGIITSRELFKSPTSYLMSTIVIETVFVTIALFAATKTRVVPKIHEPDSLSFVVWLLGIPALLFAVGVNILYHRVLSDLFHLPVEDDEISRLGSFGAAFVMVCVVPALWEEFYFRGVTWKALRFHMDPHTTVFVTAVMFGLAHIGVVLSVPILFGIGILLGYARLWSGGLLLPMILHFLHNLIIILYVDL